jgi:malate synthase
VTPELVKRLEAEELAKIRQSHGSEVGGTSQLEHARGLFDEVALSEQFVEFLTLPAYRYIE